MALGIATIALGMAFVATAGGTAHAAAPPGYVYEQAYFDSADGTRLHADVVRPADSGPARRVPVVVLVTPYNAHGGRGVTPNGFFVTEPPRQTNASIFKTVLRAYEHGYAVVVVDLRGSGGSEGCWDNGGPGEQADVKAGVEWSADQAWSNGRVALAGISYDGWTGIMGLATSPRGLVGVIALAPIVDRYRGYYSGGVPTWEGHFLSAYFGLATESYPSIYDRDVRYLEGSADRTGGRCWADQADDVSDPDARRAFWTERDLADRASKSDVPVFGSQGFLDAEAHVDQLPALYPRLRNAHGLWLGQFPHSGPQHADELGIKGGAEQMDRFLQEVLLARVPTVDDAAITVQSAPDLRWRTEQSWPPADAEPFTVPIRPGSYTDASGNVSGDNRYLDGNAAPPGVGRQSLPTSNGPNGQGHWTFTRPLDHDVHTAGWPRVEADATGPAGSRLVALLYDVSPEGNAYLITRGASRITDETERVKLNPQDWRLEAGHRLGLLLTAADDIWWVPHAGSGQPVEVARGALTMPYLRYARTEHLEGGRGYAWDLIKRPIRIDDGTIADGTVAAALPPAQQRRGPRRPLQLTVEPLQTRTARGTTFVFSTRVGGRAVRGAVVRFAGRRARTDRWGHARITRRFARPGIRRATAVKAGFSRALARVRVVPARDAHPG